MRASSVAAAHRASRKSKGSADSGKERASLYSKGRRYSITGADELAFAFEEPEKITDSTVAKKMLEEKYEDITIHDVEALIWALRAGELPPPKEVRYDDLRLFLTKALDLSCREEEVRTIWDVSDVNEDGHLTAEELHESIRHGAVKFIYQHLHRDDALFGMHGGRVHHEKSLDKPDVTRELLCDRVEWRVNRDDAFLTLPYAISYMMLFLLMVSTHLRVWERHRLQNAMEQYIVNWSKDWGGPNIQEHIVDVGSFFIWMDDSALPAVLGEQTINDKGLPAVIMASRNWVIGDIALVQQRRDSDGSLFDEETVWLLNSAVGQAALKSGTGAVAPFKFSYLEAAKAKTKQLRQTGWTDQTTEILKLVWCTYNDQAKMFSMSEVKVEYDPFGFVMPTMSSIAVMTQPYPSPVIFAFLPFYLFCIMFPLWQEGKEMCSAARHGMRVFINYWGFWNCIDWANVVFGVGSSAMWIVTCQKMTAEPLQNIIGEDFDMNPKVMALTVAQIEDIHAALRDLITCFFILHLSMAGNVASLTMKLFKAFQSNARLSVVTDTLKSAAVDITHFLIVFMVIFMSFAEVAHCLFGGDLVEFTSFGASMMTCVHILMGDFGWYVDFQVSPEARLASGIPGPLLTIWFLTFNAFVLLVLLNMLLAVILEKYVMVSMELEGSSEAPTLWLQVARYFKRRRETKGFVPLPKIMNLLHKPEVHEGNVVSIDTLLEAFPDMTVEQADYLMAWLSKEAHAKKPKGENLEDVGAKLRAIESFVNNIIQELHVVSMNVNSCNKKVHVLEKQQYPSGSGGRSGGPPPETDALLSRFAKQLREQQSSSLELSETVDRLSENVATLTSKPDMSLPAKAGDIGYEEKMREELPGHSLPPTPFPTRISPGARSLQGCCGPGALSEPWSVSSSPGSRVGDLRDGWPAQKAYRAVSGN